MKNIIKKGRVCETEYQATGEKKICLNMQPNHQGNTIHHSDHLESNNLFHTALFKYNCIISTSNHFLLNYKNQT